MSILTAFNDHFFEFVNDIQEIFPDDHDLLVSKNSLMVVRKANPKMIVKIWNAFIVDKYKPQIERGEIAFFIDKDYSMDLENAQNANHIIEAINRLREPIRMMTPQEQAKTMKYIQNLTKLSAMC